jgi:regulator of replication initiation timing
MTPDQEAKLFETIGRIDERTEQTSKAVEHLRSDITDLYGENKKDRASCEKYRGEINNKIEEEADKKEQNEKWSIEMKPLSTGLFISLTLGVTIIS